MVGPSKVVVEPWSRSEGLDLSWWFPFEVGRWLESLDKVCGRGRAKALRFSASVSDACACHVPLGAPSWLSFPLNLKPEP